MKISRTIDFRTKAFGTKNIANDPKYNPLNL